MSQNEHKKYSLISETDSKRDIRKKETSIIKKIMKYFMIALLAIVLIGGIFTWNYINGEVKPVDSEQTELVEFEINQVPYQTSICLPLREHHFISYSQNPRPIPVYVDPHDDSQFLIDDNDIYAITNKIQIS